MTTPTLTTLRVSREALGSLALEVMLNRIRHPDWPRMKMAIMGELIPRGSTKKVIP
ncbi:MAG: LacI family transcriptional regulator [Clostridiales bacterium]|nr:LacI family transcriptional regulator [Clostridiales bacterium]